MKECQKWWNEEQTAVTGKEFLAKHGDLTTQEQVIDVLVEMTWRAALEWVLSLDSEFCQCGVLEDKIEQELQDE